MATKRTFKDMLNEAKTSRKPKSEKKNQKDSKSLFLGKGKKRTRGY
jgi:hypothetical protein